MILLLGASGHVGQAFSRELLRRGYDFVPLTRKALDYSDFDRLFGYMRRTKPEFLINAAGYPGRPNVDACEAAREETLAANTLLPQTIARVCLMTNTAWGHVSSGSIYSGAKLVENGRTRIAQDLGAADFRRLQSTGVLRGFTERDAPNFSFRCTPCNFYSGAKALAEEVIREIGQSYIWRPGIPFSAREETRNFLWRIQQYPKVHDGIVSLSHVDEFARACLNLWERQAPFGTYNIANPGATTTAQAIGMIQRILRPERRFEFWRDDEEFYRYAARAPRSNCMLDVSKLQAAGVEMRPVEEALEDALRNWQPADTPLELVFR